jgi:hypothetical protein
MKFVIWIERHELGPRLHLFGRRIHEYQLGLTILAAAPGSAVARSAYFSPWTAVVALAGLWLVVKDWPDLFPATRDTASWRFGIHRLPCTEKAPHQHATPLAGLTLGRRLRVHAPKIGALAENLAGSPRTCVEPTSSPVDQSKPNTGGRMTTTMAAHRAKTGR